MAYYFMTNISIFATTLIPMKGFNGKEIKRSVFSFWRKATANICSLPSVRWQFLSTALPFVPGSLFCSSQWAYDICYASQALLFFFSTSLKPRKTSFSTSNNKKETWEFPQSHQFSCWKGLPELTDC